MRDRLLKTWPGVVLVCGIFMQLPEAWNCPDCPRRPNVSRTILHFDWNGFVWNTNLALFVTALAALTASLLMGQALVALLSLLLVMVLTIIAVEQFAVRVPKVHLTEFTEAFGL